MSTRLASYRDIATAMLVLIALVAGLVLTASHSADAAHGHHRHHVHHAGAQSGAGLTAVEVDHHVARARAAAASSKPERSRTRVERDVSSHCPVSLNRTHCENCVDQVGAKPINLREQLTFASQIAYAETATWGALGTPRRGSMSSDLLQSRHGHLRPRRNSRPMTLQQRFRI